MFRILIILLPVLSATTGCHKPQTRVCECWTPSGELHSTRSATSRDTEVIEQFEKDCVADGVITTRTNGSTSTSTFVPCTLK